MAAFTLSRLAGQTGSELHGDGSCVIERVADIRAATTGCIVFVTSSRYRKLLETTGASAAIVTEELLPACRLPALVAKNPRLVFARIANLLHPAETAEPGVSPQAVIEEGARVDPAARVEPAAVIRRGAVVAGGVWIGPGCVVESGASVGANTRLYASVTIGRGSSIGERCILHAGVVIGADGFGFERDGDRYIKFPQIGNVRIGNDVEIGANTTVDRGALLDTVIHDGVKLDNQIQIGHNVEIGEHTVISACTCIAGTTKIGRYCLIGGSVGIRDNIEITDNVIITGRTLVSRSITKPGSYSSSTPIDDTESWRKNAARFRQLDSLARRVSKLESGEKE